MLILVDNAKCLSVPPSLLHDKVDRRNLCVSLADDKVNRRDWKESLPEHKVNWPGLPAA
jgi:hypothetical protein